MHKQTPHLDNLGAFLAEAKASVDYKKDLELIRSTYNMTQTQMAEQFGVSHTTIGKWLRGEVKPKCLIIIHLTAEGLRKQR
jgi:DNA-binding XRE family transcriptional regulator